MLKGFRDFIMRGNVIDLAVAVVIGAAFTAIVNSIVTSVFNPIIGAIFDAKSLDKSLPLMIPTYSGGHATIFFGAVIGAAINFILVAIVVYFVFVMPINHVRKMADKRREAGQPPADTPVTELDLLTEIRDLLQAEASARSRTDQQP
jgi:large conductance mechanosensitive channel